jgi:hypothetical protein
MPPVITSPTRLSGSTAKPEVTKNDKAADHSKIRGGYLTQSLPTYYAKMGGDNPRDAAHALVGKFTTNIFHSNACPETNEYASRVIGKVTKRRANYSAGNSTSVNVGMSAGSNDSWGSSSSSGSSFGGKGNFGTNWNSGENSGGGNNWGENRVRGTSRNESRGYSENMEYAIEPGDFARCLKTGGPENRNHVTGIWFQAGRVFKASGMNFLLGRFKQ